MKISEIASALESIAPLSLQEDYDNAGLLIGNPDVECIGILVSLDVTEAVIDEAVKTNCNLVVAHHPIIFRGIKKLNGKNYVERTVISAIKNNIAVYAIHTNLDNVLHGVNRMIAEKLGLQNCSTLSPKKATLQKLTTFAPVENADAVRNSLFEAGAGGIGKYGECSFNVEGLGTFTATEGSHPFIGKIGEKHQEKEIRIEVVFPTFLQGKIIQSLKSVHPYEEVAYYIHSLENVQDDTGSGLVGDLADNITETQLFNGLRTSFHLSMIKHTPFLNKPVKKIAVCGGAGIFLLNNAIAAGAQVYITSDIKYHEFFDAEGKILLVDIGHYESEQFTIELLIELLQQKFPNFAILKTEIDSNPVNYFI